jgi:hypothetical protein
LLFKRTVSRLFIRYQNCGYKTNGFQPRHFHKVYRGISSSSIDDLCAPLLQVLYTAQKLYKYQQNTKYASGGVPDSQADICCYGNSLDIPDCILL